MQLITADVIRKASEGDYTLIDTRPLSETENGFIPGSVLLPHTENFQETLRLLLTHFTNPVFIAETTMAKTIQAIIAESDTEEKTYLLQGGYKAWTDASYPMDLIITIEADEFAIDYKHDDFLLVDARTPQEFEQTHVEGAEQVSVLQAEIAAADWDSNDSYYVYGNTAAEALTVASLLRRAGFVQVRVVADTFENIVNSGVPLFVKPKKQDKPA